MMWYISLLKKMPVRGAFLTVASYFGLFVLMVELSQQATLVGNALRLAFSLWTIVSGSLLFVYVFRRDWFKDDP